MNQTAMDPAVDSAWEKRGFIAGIIFVVLNVVAFVVSGQPPAIDAPVEEIDKYFADDGSGLQTAAILFSISVVFGTIWLASLWRAIGKLEPRGPRLAVMVVVGFVISGAAAGVSQAMMGGYSMRFADTGGGGDFVWAVANSLFGVALAGIAIHMLALSMLTMRSGFLPKWTAWLALVSGVAALVGTAITGSDATWVVPFLMIGFLAWLLWVLIASILLYRKAT